MQLTGSALKTPSTPNGIVNLELASSRMKVEKVIQAWAPISGEVNRIGKAKTNTYLDFIFILFYSPFLFLCCKKVAEPFKKNLIYKAGDVIAKGALLAGVLDLIENAGMLQSLHGNITEPVALLTAAVSIAKWTLILITLIFILFVLVYQSFNWRKKE